MDEMYENNYNHFRPYPDADQQILWQGAPGFGKLSAGQGPGQTVQLYVRPANSC